LVLTKSPKVLKLWTSVLSTKCRVMALVICSLTAEQRRDKGRFGSPRDRKVPRKDLVIVSSRGVLGGGLKEVPV
jgi:hypothetical protein